MIANKIVLYSNNTTITTQQPITFTGSATTFTNKNKPQYRFENVTQTDSYGVIQSLFPHKTSLPFVGIQYSGTRTETWSDGTSYTIRKTTIIDISYNEKLLTITDGVQTPYIVSSSYPITYTLISGQYIPYSALTQIWSDGSSVKSGDPEQKTQLANKKTTTNVDKYQYRFNNTLISQTYNDIQHTVFPYITSTTTFYNPSSTYEVWSDTSHYSK